MSVHKNKSNNTWYVKFKNKTKRGFKTKHEAQQYEAKLMLEDKTNEIVYFKVVCNDYLEYLKKNVTYATYSKHKSIIEKVIIPNTEDKDIHKINEMDCRKFREYVQDLDYSTVYKNYILQQYKTIFKHAKKFYGLKNDSTISIDPFKKSYSEKLKKKEKEINVWTDEEFGQFIQYVKNDTYKQLFIVLYFTGIRLGEALALTWNDYYDNKLNINKSVTKITQNGEHLIKEPKNVSSIREIELGSVLSRSIDEYKIKEMKVSGFNENWFMFGRINPLGRSHITRVKDMAIKKANLKRIRLHDFRHSHASNLIANNINIVAVSKRLGHSDVNMTLEVYTHLFKKSSDELVNFIDETSQKLLKQ